MGVSAPILVAIWGLETGFGAVTGNVPTIGAIATLAYDCRRSDMFRAELFDALRVVQRGDGSVNTLRGPGPARSAKRSSCPPAC